MTTTDDRPGSDPTAESDTNAESGEATDPDANAKSDASTESDANGESHATEEPNATAETDPEVLRDLDRRVSDAPGSVVGLDFDGTLAPIREDPDAPSITSACKDAVEALAARPDTAVAVVSGRALTDLRERVGVEGVVYVGNHGLELAAGDGAFVQQTAADSREHLREVTDRVATALEEVPGAEIEDKRLTVTVHHRNTPGDRVPEVEAAVDDALEAVEGPVEKQSGKEILELRPATDWDKGSAMQWLAGRSPADWQTIYVGDDTTDEDVFETLGPGDIGVHVGDGETAASFRLPDREAVAPFLRWLAARRDRSGAATEGGDDGETGENADDTDETGHDGVAGEDPPRVVAADGSVRPRRKTG